MAISPGLWKRVVRKTKPLFDILTFYDEQNPRQCIQGEKVQVQIVFCAKDKSEAFVGFLDSNSNIISAVRSIGFQLGFIEMQNSRIIFPDKNPEKLFYFFELEQKNISDLPDTLLMAFNLETSELKSKDFSFGKKQAMGDSNEAVAGELDVLSRKSWEHIRNDGTMSTGAETPSFIFSDNQHTQFRVRELFREKKPE